MFPLAVSTRPDKAAVNGIILRHAVLVGLTPLIPIPLLDDVVKSFFARSMIQSLAHAASLALTDDEVAALAEERSGGLSGCAFGLVEYGVKRLVRKLVFVLEWRRAVDLVTRTYYAGRLLAYAFAEGHYRPGDAGQADRLRLAVEQARSGANTKLVRTIIGATFRQSRALIADTVKLLALSINDVAFRRSRGWLRRGLAVRLRRRAPRLARWLYNWARPSPAEAAQTANAVAQAMQRESPRLQMSLGGLIERLQVNLSVIPDDHFYALQARLAAELGPAHS